MSNENRTDIKYPRRLKKQRDARCFRGGGRGGQNIHKIHIDGGNSNKCIMYFKV